MYKNYFHNNKLNNISEIKKKLPATNHSKSKITVDINKLLNRIKIEKKNDTKRQIVNFSLIVLGLGFVTFIIL
tara:strand:- start:1449 stop:1667 length:219 start_codon:yes stop_codon:yes gene_type:complete